MPSIYRGNRNSRTTSRGPIVRPKRADPAIFLGREMLGENIYSDSDIISGIFRGVIETDGIKSQNQIGKSTGRGE